MEHIDRGMFLTWILAFCHVHGEERSRKVSTPVLAKGVCGLAENQG